MRKMDGWEEHPSIHFSRGVQYQSWPAKAAAVCRKNPGDEKRVRGPMPRTRFMVQSGRDYFFLPNFAVSRSVRVGTPSSCSS